MTNLTTVIGQPEISSVKNLTQTFKRNVAQGALTVLVKIKPGEVDELRRILQQIEDEDVETNSVIPFIQIRSVHFARFVILHESKDLQGNTIPASLAFSTNYDQPLDNHLQQLVDIAGKGLESIFKHCQDYPPVSDASSCQSRLLPFLHSHKMPYMAFYIGTRGRSVEQILYEANIRNAIEDFLDKERKQTGFAQLDPLRMHTRIQQFVKNTFPEAEQIYTAPGTSAREGFFATYSQLLLVLGCLAVLVAVWIMYPVSVSLVLATVVVIFLGLLRYYEIRDKETDSRIDIRNIQNLTSKENQIVQNQLTHLVDVKPGLFRQFTLRLVLKSINLLARYVFNKGKLGDIPTIHFARWVIIDEGRRLLFFSNFDGSWENYLGDFVDKASVGLTGVWSNTMHFPKTLFLLLKGAKDEQRFKTWARNHQIVTQVWYSAYKTLTVENINNNSKICSQLFSSMNIQQAKAWLQLL